MIKVERSLLHVLVAIVLTGCSPAAEPAKSVAPQKVAPATLQGTESAIPSIADPPHHFTELLRLIRQRLDLMPGVAQAKWNRKLPITDEKREAALLADLQSKGVALGLPADFVREFFEAQISAAKQVQEELFAEWTARQQSQFPNAPDLQNEVRPRIDDLNQKLLTALHKCWAERSDGGWNDRLNQAIGSIFREAAWSSEVTDTALQPVRDIRG